jgi:hypothetical protein
MTKKKKSKSVGDLLPTHYMRHELFVFTMQTRFQMGLLIERTKELKLNECSDFTHTFVELVNARHSLAVFLEHPVFKGALADVTLTNLTGDDQKT